MMRNVRHLEKGTCLNSVRMYESSLSQESQGWEVTTSVTHGDTVVPLGGKCGVCDEWSWRGQRTEYSIPSAVDWRSVCTSTWEFDAERNLTFLPVIYICCTKSCDSMFVLDFGFPVPRKNLSAICHTCQSPLEAVSV